MASREERIRATALSLGFSLCGFARVQSPAHAEFVRRWVAEGHAADMSYIGRRLSERLDPTLVLPGARSVITVGYPYRPPPAPPLRWREELRGRIAAYALGPDYHDRMKTLLQQLALFVKDLDGDARVREYVDTGPVLEREWGAAGGVGWFGKNTNLLHRREGSWFFLGEVLTTVELDPDDPISDHCGTCSRCLDDCPTQALRGEYVLDARRCISYWTIERRGPIPSPFRPQLQNWVFGCDICQEVCPWNSGDHLSPRQRDGRTLTPRLAELMALDEEAFRRRYGGTAVLRTRREGLLRNAAVALGNSGNPDAVGVLLPVLTNEPSELVRAHVAWALGELGGWRARSALENVRNSNPGGLMGAEIDAALKRL